MQLNMKKGLTGLFAITAVLAGYALINQLNSGNFQNNEQSIRATQMVISQTKQKTAKLSLTSLKAQATPTVNLSGVKKSLTTDLTNLVNQTYTSVSNNTSDEESKGKSTSTALSKFAKQHGNAIESPWQGLVSGNIGTSGKHADTVNSTTVGFGHYDQAAKQLPVTLYVVYQRDNRQYADQWTMAYHTDSKKLTKIKHVTTTAIAANLSSQGDSNNESK